MYIHNLGCKVCFQPLTSFLITSTLQSQLLMCQKRIQRQSELLAANTGGAYATSVVKLKVPKYVDYLQEPRLTGRHV